MNTPAHAVVNLVLLSRRGEAETLWPVLLGGILPDLPMVAFYGWEKLIARTSESVIWNEKYFDPEWQAIFDIPNSLPLLALGLAAAWAVQRRAWCFLFLSMILHVLGDFPLHQEDAHRHFFPLSEWRYVSPVSYWNPSSYGAVVSLVEIGLVLAGAITLFRRHPTSGVRLGLAVLGASYLAYFGYVLVVWV